MRITATVLVLGVAIAQGEAQRTIRVPADQPTIGAAITAAQASDTILVAPGDYVEDVDFAGKAIVLRSTDGAALTTITGTGAGTTVRFRNGEGPGAVLEGFTVRGGRASGIQCIQSSPVIRDCRIVGNRARVSSGFNFWSVKGGGIYCSSAGALIERCEISGNQAVVDTGNNAAWAVASGGGIATDASNITIRGCTIVGNTASANSSYQGCTACPSAAATALAGGVQLQGPCILESSVVANNRVRATVFSSPAPGQSPSGIVADATALVNSCTIWGNRGGVAGMSGGVVANCIVRANDAPQVTAGTPCTHCNIEGGFPGAGNIDVDPRMLDPNAGDFHLRWDSPCRDAGTAAPVGPTALDYEGDPRQSGAAPDIGADEFHPHLYVTGNTTPGGIAHIKIVGAPGQPAYLGYSAANALLSPPLMIPGAGLLYLPAPLFVVGVGSIGPIGVNLLAVPLPASLPRPLQIPIQALVGATLTNPVLVVIA